MIKASLFSIATMICVAIFIQPASASSRTGCYLGAGVGGAWNDQDVSTTGSFSGDQAPAAGSLSDATLVGSLYGGCAWQFSSSWVAGLEADFNWTRIADQASAPNLLWDGTPVGSGGLEWSNDINRFGSLRGRLGFLATPAVLLYGTGGIAWADISYQGMNAGVGGCPNCRTTSVDTTLNGFVVGGGVDWKLAAGNWLMRLEYLHYQFSDAHSVVQFGANIHGFNWGETSIDVVRIGTSYQF